MNEIQKNEVKKQEPSIAAILTSPEFKEQLAIALPKHMNANKIARIALTEIRKMPALASCTLSSFQSALLMASQIGLEVGSGFGHAYLIPYGKECQLIIGYRGMIQLAHRSGLIKSMHVDVVYKDDIFECQSGINPVFKHEKSIGTPKKREDIILSYAYVHLLTGGFEFVVCEREDIDRIRSASRSRNIWTEHFEEMAKKTAVRRLFKIMPISSEIMNIVSIDDNHSFSPSFYPAGPLEDICESPQKATKMLEEEIIYLSEKQNEEEL